VTVRNLAVIKIIILVVILEFLLQYFSFSSPPSKIQVIFWASTHVVTGALIPLLP
jgi:hypothetical protein